MSRLPEKLSNLPAIQQRLGQGEDLHFAQKPSRKELNQRGSGTQCVITTIQNPPVVLMVVAPI